MSNNDQKIKRLPESDLDEDGFPLPAPFKRGMPEPNTIRAMNPKPKPQQPKPSTDR